MIENDLEIYNREGTKWWDETGPFQMLRLLNPPRFEYFDRFVDSWEGLKVLDVGCGGGFTCEFLAKRGAKVTGIDLSEVSLETARSHAQTNNLNIQYKKADARNLPFVDNSFDIVVCVDVLEHINPVDSAISEISRVLTHKGQFFFDTINKNFLSKLVIVWLMERVLRKIPLGTHDWNMFIKPQNLKMMLENNDLGFIDFAGLAIYGVNPFKNQLISKINNNKSLLYLGKAQK